MNDSTASLKTRVTRYKGRDGIERAVMPYDDFEKLVANGCLVEVAESHPKGLVWVKPGETLEQAILEHDKPAHKKRHNRKMKQ